MGAGHHRRRDEQTEERESMAFDRRPVMSDELRHLYWETRGSETIFERMRAFCEAALVRGTGLSVRQLSRRW